MNKVISFKELLKLVEESKAPKKITFDSYEFEYYENDNFYYTAAGKSLYEFMIDKGNALNERIEVLEEEVKPLEWEDIKELNIGENVQYRPADIFNSLIRNQKYLKNKIEGK